MVRSRFGRGAAVGEKGILYSFEAPLFGYTRSVPAVIKSEREWVEKFIPFDEFERLFGGYVTWHPTDEIAETIVVWGKRNVSRFRHILKERGADLDVIENEGPKQQAWVLTSYGYTRRFRHHLPNT